MDFLREVFGRRLDISRVPLDDLYESINAALVSYASDGSPQARRATFIRYRFGIDDGQRHTLEETGAHFAVSRSRAGDLVAEGVVSLRSQRLIELLLPAAAR